MSKFRSIIDSSLVSNSILNGEILPSSYNYKRDRASRGGGELLAVKDNLSSQLLMSLNPSIVKIHSSRFFIVCGLYIPPSTNELDHTQVSEVLCSLPLNLDVLILVIGDFNFPDIDWDILNGDSEHSSNFDSVGSSVILTDVN